MDINKDAYGQEMWAFFKGKESYEVIERDDGFIDLSTGASAYFAEFKKWPKIQKQAIRFAKGRVLDVGAGVGRVSLYLQKKKFDVTAIDNSPLAIKICKKRGVKHAKVLPIERISTFKANTFDTIILFGNNFGLFGSYNKAKKLLKIFHRITSQDALIISENLDPYKTNDPVHISYHTLNKKRGRMPGQIRMRLRFKKCIGDWFDYLFVSKDELKDIIKGTGWKVKKFISSNGPIYAAIIEKE